MRFLTLLHRPALNPAPQCRSYAHEQATLFPSSRARPAGRGRFSRGAGGAVGGLDSLEQFVKGTRSGKAAFTQVVTAPAKDGQTPRARTQSGTFEFQRPGKFRFVYVKPFEQTIVADGKALWLHDVDLNKVTSRPQDQVLGSTPAAIVAAAPDLKALEKDFTLSRA